MDQDSRTAFDAAHERGAALLQTVADAAALAGVVDIDSESEAKVTAVQYALSNSPGLGVTVTINDVELGQWDEATSSFISGAVPPNAVQVTAQRNNVRNNAVPYLFARLFGNDDGDVSATSIAVAQAGAGGGNIGTRFLIDNEMIDGGIEAIEELADSLGVDKDDLVSDNDGDWFIDIPPDTILELPTGQVGDEGMFQMWPGYWPFTNVSDESHQDFLNYNEDSSSWRYDLIDKDDLDPLVGIGPARDPNDYPGFVDSDYIHVSPIYKSDLSYIGKSGGVPQINALGERRGLLAFKIIALGDDPDGSGSQFPNLVIKVVDPDTMTISDTGYWQHELDGGGGGPYTARLVG